MEFPSYDEIHATTVGFLIVFLFHLTGESEVVLLILTSVLEAEGEYHLADTRRELAYATAGALGAHILFSPRR